MRHSRKVNGKFKRPPITSSLDWLVTDVDAVFGASNGHLQLRRSNGCLNTGQCPSGRRPRLQNGAKQWQSVWMYCHSDGSNGNAMLASGTLYWSHRAACHPRTAHTHCSAQPLQQLHASTCSLVSLLLSMSCDLMALLRQRRNTCSGQLQYFSIHCRH